jgi:predicted metalloendopeptidase
VGISARIGWMNRYGIPAPIAVYIQGDPRDHRKCRVFIEEGEPRIGIPEYWEDDQYAGHRKAYGVYVRRLATITGLPGLNYGYSAEQELAHVYPKALERRKRMDMLTWKELNDRYSVINWTSLFDSWGLRDPHLKEMLFNVTSTGFLHHIERRMSSWSPQRWGGWFALICAQWIAGLSPHGPLRDAWFAYNRRFLQGMKTDDTKEELRHAIIRAVMPNTLGKLWVQDYCSHGMRRNILAMVRRIQNAAIATIAATPWMALSTRKAAIRKLRRMDIQVGWPDEKAWKTYEVACVIRPDNYIENLMSLGAESTDQNIDLIQTHGCQKPLGANWGRPVYEVNAFYYPDENRFMLPAAILRPPFYDPTKSLASNYGSIGATIGHEFCHAFDSDGRNYDEHGDKHDWWKEGDAREYNRRAAKVVRLFETRTYRGMDVDGVLTQVENIADLGGLEFALAGLRAELRRELTKEEKQEFFMSYAVSWRSKDRLKRAAQLSATDYHAPPMLRVNHMVRQFDEWYEAFDIDVGCAEFIKPESRIHFFGPRS